MEQVPSLTVGMLMRSGEASLQTGPFGTQLSAKEYVADGVPVINVRNIGFGEVRADDLEYITEVKAERLHHHVLRCGDIVFGRKGAVERHALISSDQDGWVQGSDCLRLRLNSQRVNRKYLSYYLRTKAHQDWMQALCSFGATMSSLNQDIVSRIQFPAPLLETQLKIAAILSAYDDLIANNQRRIALLETTADEIYREWFVRMRFPGHETAPLVHGLPEGWTELRVSDVAGINGRSIRRGHEPEAIRYVDISAVSTNEMGEPEELSFGKAPGRARRLVCHGDVLWSSVRPGNKAYCIVIEPPESLVASTGFAVISPKPGTPYTYLHKAVTTQNFTDQMVAVAKGSAYPATSFDDFGKARIVWPRRELLETYHMTCQPMYECAAGLRKAMAILRKQRDAMLPRLISGKLKVDHLDIRMPPSMRTVAAA